MSKLILIFSDLDGTMLSHLDYSYGELKTIIKELGKEKDHYVIIPCTSKTEIEVLSFGKNVGLSGPFIVENGGKIMMTIVIHIYLYLYIIMYICNIHMYNIFFSSD